MTRGILLSGFGGQGVLFAGKQLAIAAMGRGQYVTWLPSYGPEMRGGTANCGVIISREPIGSPLVTSPDILVAMNLPSYEKFEPTVLPGGILVLDSSMVSGRSARGDLDCVYLPATALADENGIKGLANVILLGGVLRAAGLFDKEYFIRSMTESIPASRAGLIEANKRALEIGYCYQS